MKHIYVRNLDQSTFNFLEKRASELSSKGNNISVNMLIGTILNQHYLNSLMGNELTEIQKVNQKMDNLTEAVTDLTLTYQDLIELQRKGGNTYD